MWPGTKPIGTYWRTIDARTYIGPVTTVKVGPTYATIFVRGWWINVWKRTQKKTGLGVFFAIQVPEEEVRRWRDSGWYDEP